MKEIDLEPHEFSSERPKKKEPFWGDGWPGALAYLIGFAIVFFGLRYFSGK